MRCRLRRSSTLRRLTERRQSPISSSSSSVASRKRPAKRSKTAGESIASQAKTTRIGEATSS
jgi:hypothetical protein